MSRRRSFQTGLPAGNPLGYLLGLLGPQQQAPPTASAVGGTRPQFPGSPRRMPAVGDFRPLMPAVPAAGPQGASGGLVGPPGGLMGVGAPSPTPPTPMAAPVAPGVPGVPGPRPVPPSEPSVQPGGMAGGLPAMLQALMQNPQLLQILAALFQGGGAPRAT